MCSHKNRLIEAILMSTHNIPFSMLKKKITLIYPKSVVMGFCSNGLKSEFETAVVNKPSVFEPLKFYCISTGYLTLRQRDNTRTTYLLSIFFLNQKYLSSNLKITKFLPVVV